MAGFQSARDDVRAEGIAEWMARRHGEVAARGPEAEFAGRAAWAAGGVTGELPYAPRPADVVTLGARSQRGRGREGAYAVADGSASSTALGRRSTSGTSARGQVAVAYRPTSAAGPAAPGAPRPTPEDEMTKLRREQAALKDVVREESRRNSWMAIPALAPIAVPLLAEGAALLTGRLAASQLNRAPLNLLGREPGLAPKPPVSVPRPNPLSTPEKTALRDAARTRYAQANPGYGKAWEVDIHHRIDLRFSHLFPKADPNRLANLAALQKGAHNLVTQATNRFLRALGREPTPTEVMAHKLELDKLVETYLVRAGVPRPPPGAPK